MSGGYIGGDTLATSRGVNLAQIICLRGTICKNYDIWGGGGI